VEKARPLSGARILLGVTGGVAAYKAPELARALVKEGARVSVMLTRRAGHFVTRDALRAVTRGPVLSGLFEAGALGDGPWFEGAMPSPLGMAHIGMAREADLVLVAPATANVIAKLASGLADDLLSTTLLATRSPVLIAPAMNVAMWEHAAVRANMATLASRGVLAVGPEEGELADGEFGMGRMASIEAIVAACADVLRSAKMEPPGSVLARARAAVSGGPSGARAAEKPSGSFSPASAGKRLLQGRTIVVTAGGTEEPIDPVRVITNRSSGKMGFAIAEEALAMGARVRLIVARTSATPPAGAERIDAPTASAMSEAVLEAMADADALVMSAAVSDFSPAEPSAVKLPRKAGGLTLTLRPTPDILRQVRERHPKKLIVGFALETEDELARGKDKLKRKGVDLIAINNPLRPGADFGSDQNEVTLVDAKGEVTALGLRAKRDVAREILVRVAKALAK
jgi:phosphopantothenoylcysteine decarboxylase/phosphopantothenate--cysteine ligase